MNCQEYLSLMSQYVDGDMGPADRNLWKKHFDDCPPCQKFFSSFESSLELLRYFKTHKCPDSIAGRLEGILQEKAQSMQLKK